MAKKYKAKEQVKAAAIPAPAAKNSFRFNGYNIIPVAVCLLYFMVHFIANFDAYDAMGPQWLYMVALDMVVTIFIIARKDHYLVATTGVFKNNFSKLYLAFFALSGISIITAINPTEGWVCYVRLIATVVAYFNVSILLYRRTDLFKILAQILALILLYESYQTISDFLKGIGSLSLEQVIMDLKGTAGNKNIFAAGLVVKIPFVLYGMHTYKLWGKILNTIIFILGSLAIFIVNARASYLSLLLILLMYIAFCVVDYFKKKNLEQTLSRVGFVLIPILIAFFVSQMQMSSAKSIQSEDEKGKDFGSVTERLSTIAKTDDESNQVRFRLWTHAIDYTKHHPLMGCGIGNWKIASVPYQRTITNDLYVPVHAHNDFLEVFAELGVLGGLIYLCMFICIIVFTYKTYFSNAEENTKLISVFSLMAMAGYVTDATFNFPLERPISQIFFMFITAVNVVAFMKGREEDKKEEVTEKKPAIKPLFGFVAILFLVPSFYVTYMTYKSLIVQRSVLGDINNEPLKLDWKMIMSTWSSIPNLTATAQPVDAIKGRYVYEAGHYEEALVLLDKGRLANPVVGYSEFLKAGVYFRMAKYDSAARNAWAAFEIRPKAKTYFQTLVAVLAKQRDTMGIKKAFAEYDRYRHWASGWNMYLLGMLNATGRGNAPMLAMADSALKMFPDEAEAKDVAVRRNEILASMQLASAPGAKPADIVSAQRWYALGVAAFGSGNAATDSLAKAAGYFLKAAALSPNDYTTYENAAMCYFNLRDFPKSLIYFDKALALKTSVNGKSEFFKGVALINTGKGAEGCTFLHIAKAKNYKEKEAELNAILKSRCGEK